MSLDQWINSTLKNHQKKHNPPFFEVEHIIDYLKLHPTFRLQRLSYPQAKVKADNWTKALNKKNKGQKDAGQVDVVISFPNGMKMVRLLDQASKNWEGVHMGHCVAGYKDHKGIYSLRDVHDYPHCTMEINGRKINQVKGKANRKINLNLSSYILEFIKQENLNMDDCRDDFLSDMGFHRFYSKVHQNIILKNFDNVDTLRVGKTLYYQNRNHINVRLKNETYGLGQSIFDNRYDYNNALAEFVRFAISIGGKDICDFLLQPGNFNKIRPILKNSFSLVYKNNLYDLLPALLPLVNIREREVAMIYGIKTNDSALLNILVSDSGAELKEVDISLIALAALSSKSLDMIDFLINYNIPEIKQSLLVCLAEFSRQASRNWDLIDMDAVKYVANPEFKDKLISRLTGFTLTERQVNQLVLADFPLMLKCRHLDQNNFLLSENSIKSNLSFTLSFNSIKFFKEYHPCFYIYKDALLSFGLRHFEAETIFLLMEAGAKLTDANSADIHRVICHSARENKVALVKALLDMGYNPHLFDYELLQTTTRNKNQELRQLVVDRIAKTPLPNPDLEEKSKIPDYRYGR